MQAHTHAKRAYTHLQQQSHRQTDKHVGAHTLMHSQEHINTHMHGCLHAHAYAHTHTHTQLPSLKSISIHLPEVVVVVSFVFAKAWF